MIARLKARKAEATSDLNSDCDAKQNRKISKKKVIDSDSEESLVSESNQLPTPPIISLKTTARE